MFKLWNLF